MIKNNIGQKIKERRLALGLTLEELGNKVGVGASTVRKWETNFIKDMKSDKVQKVAEALNVSPAYLMGWDENQNVNIEQVHTNNGLIGQANASVYFGSKNEPQELSKEESELIRIYRALNVKNRLKLLTTAIDLEDSEK